MLGWLLACALAGCATSTRRDARTAAHPDIARPRPSCRTNVRLLAAAAHKPQGAILATASGGFAMVWAEQAERATLRFLLVDRDGGPRSPSAEVVDRGAPLTPLDVHLVGEAAYEIAWREGADGAGKTFSRQVDARGRPRTDVVDAKPALGTPPPSACAPAGAALRCKTSNDAPIELPADASIVSEHIGQDGAAVIGADAEGLKLFVQACAKE